MKNCPDQYRPLRLAAGVLCAATLSAPAHAAVVISGNYFLSPDPGSFGPGNVDLPDSSLLLGSSRRAAMLDIDGGSQATLAYLNVWGNGVASTVARIDGAGSRLDLTAVGDTNRFAVGNAASRSSVIVSGGAVLDGTAQRERCNSGGACQNVVGAAAGSEGVLTVTGAGSEARFLRLFHVGSLGYNGASGQRGLDGTGSVQVLGGGLLSTEFAILGEGYTGSNLNGTERGVAAMRVSGAGSRWEVVGSDVLGGGVRLLAAPDRQGLVNIDVVDGGTLHMASSPAGQQTEALLSTGGNVRVNVSGAGSSWRIDGDGSHGYLRLAAGAGDAAMVISDGARLDAAISGLHIGMGTGRAALTVQGAGSVAHVPSAYVYVGDPLQADPAGSGWLQVTQGGMLRAHQVEISPRGLLSGSGVILADALINRGTISPGDSPGTLRMEGHWRNEVGARLLLEVEDDGQGGYLTDLLLLNQLPDLQGLDIEFRFLGRTDPLAFLSTGAFDIDRFVRIDGTPLPDDAYASVRFTASSGAFSIRDFVYSVTDGARFSAVEIPLPGSLALVLPGLLSLSGLAAMRRRTRPA